MFDEDYYGKEEYERFGDLVSSNLSGQTVSKSKADADMPGGLIYEAELLGIHYLDLLRCLEGMCHNGDAYEISDSMYMIY